MYICLDNFFKFSRLNKNNKRIERVEMTRCFFFFSSFILQPSDSSDVLYDAKIKLSSQSITEIEALLEGKESWRTGALDNAISQILVDIRPHDSEIWRWRFEDAVGVELDTLIKVGLRRISNRWWCF